MNRYKKVNIFLPAFTNEQLFGLKINPFFIIN